MTTRRNLLRTASGAVAAGVVGGALINSAQGVDARNGLVPNLAFPAGMECLVSIVGAIQGPFTGETLREEWRNSFVGLGYYYQLTMKGTVSKKLEHRPVTITKEWGAASPQLLQAMVANEQLNTVKVEYVRFADDVHSVEHEITLINASVVDIEQYQNFNATGHQIAHFPQFLEDVSFAYQSITFRRFPGTPEELAVTYNWNK